MGAQSLNHWTPEKSLSYIFNILFSSKLHTGKDFFLFNICFSSVQFSSVQSSRSPVSNFFVTPWTAACQASLSITNSQSLLKLISIVLVMPSSHLILCCPLLLPLSIFPSIRVFSVSQFFASGGQSIGVSASTSVLPMNIQD